MQKKRSSEINLSEPWIFSIWFFEDGIQKTEKFYDVDFDRSFVIYPDEGTIVTVGLCSYKAKEFYLTETLFTVLKNGIVTNTVYNRLIGNVWCFLRAGESAIATVNCGTEISPNWVSFKIETICS